VLNSVTVDVRWPNRHRLRFADRNNGRRCFVDCNNGDIWLVVLAWLKRNGTHAAHCQLRLPALLTMSLVSHLVAASQMIGS
jgi:hypothetical protein